ncbi:MAG: glycerophosphoryl diester phosphodiesterase [Rhodoferax sp.]|jgi:glycerophosphoryl diester phosphodiesterase
MMQVTAQNWPYPRWIAHRGAGKLAPENTLAAFREGTRYGYRMFECDVKLSRDGVPFLLHDATLKRTTAQPGPAGSGVAGDHLWYDLSQLDAGSWHSSTWAGEPLPSLQNIARYCLHNHYFLNLEIKPTPGLAARTGEVIANQVAELWQQAAVPPLLTSFEPDALTAARAAQPTLPRGLLLDTLAPGWLKNALDLGCVAIVCNHTLWNPARVAEVKKAGLRTLSYTVNDAQSAQRLLDLGTDGIITDRVDLFSPA